MNYKDRDNILLIICGAMGIAALALIFRYLFIGLNFDAFGANLVFIIVFVVGLIFYITYLEFIQKLATWIFGKKKPPTEESVNVEKVEEFKPDLDSIREEHKQKELKQKEKLLEDAIQYTQTTFAPYANDENINRLCNYITDYYNGIKLDTNIQPVIVKELSNGDLFHFGWNIWNHFKPVRNNTQEYIAYFIKVVFARQLKDIDTDTIRKKLTFNEGKFKIDIRKYLD